MKKQNVKKFVEILKNTYPEATCSLDFNTPFQLVIAVSKRARQIANGDKKLTNVDEESPVTLAANEINEGKVEIIKANEEYEEENEDVTLLENEEE